MFQNLAFFLSRDNFGSLADGKFTGTDFLISKFYYRIRLAGFSA
jgi:hypothetical protein